MIPISHPTVRSDTLVSQGHLLLWWKLSAPVFSKERIQSGDTNDLSRNVFGQTRRNRRGLPLRWISVQGVLHCESEGLVNILRWEAHS